MKLYELTYLISPKLILPEAQKLAEKITDFITKEGGILGEIKNPFRQKLAYPIKKEGEGYLASLNFYLGLEKLADFEKKILSENQILRYLILTKKIPKKEITKLPKIKRIEKPKIEKVELEEIEKKLEEILGE